MMKKMIIAIFLAVIAIAVAWYIGQEYKKNSILSQQMVRLVPEKI